MLVLLPVILQLLQAGITVVPELISAAQTELALFNNGTATPTPPTAAQQAAIDAALDTANAALQAAQPGA